MPNITLPDGNKINFQNKITGLEIAKKISESLSKQALIMSVDGKLKDLSYTIEKDCSIKILLLRIMKGLKQSGMIQLIYLQWQFKNFFQVHKLQLDR